MADGKGCTCYAYASHECACDADWTPREVYDLRGMVAQLQGELESVKGEMDWLRKLAGRALVAIEQYAYDEDWGEHKSINLMALQTELSQAIALPGKDKPHDL